MDATVVFMGSRLEGKRNATDPDIATAIGMPKKGPDSYQTAFQDDSTIIINAGKITALITDLDDTFWKGTLAEKQELGVNARYYGFLKSLHKKGVQILALSKNDEEDVTAAFGKLAIDRGLFTAIIANWDPKYLTIEKLLQCTGLRPETVVFVDDNP